jgi:lambda repressor-like predicted transcriptional regulator
MPVIANLLFMSEPLTRSEVPTKPAVRRAWVRLKLAEKGIDLAEVAREHNLTRQAMYHALHHPSARVEEIIAGAIGITVQELFPERFTADGYRLSKSKHEQGSTTGRRRHVSQRSAA